MRRLSCLFAAAAILVMPGTVPAAHATCDTGNPEICPSADAGATVDSDAAIIASGGPMTIARAEPMQRVRALKRKARNTQARYPRPRDGSYYNATGVKDGADRKTPVIDFRNDTTQPGSRSEAPLDAPAQGAPMGLAISSTDRVFAAAAAANESSPFTASATASDAPATATAADPDPSRAARASEQASTSPPPAVEAYATTTNRFSAFVTSIRSTLADANVALMTRLAPDTPAASGEQTSFIGRIFLGIAGLLTAATALRILIA